MRLDEKNTHQNLITTDNTPFKKLNNFNTNSTPVVLFDYTCIRQQQKK